DSAMLILKLIGLALVAMSGFLAGEFKSRELAHRTAVLYALQGYLLFLSQNIKYRKDALPILLQESAALCQFKILCFKPENAVLQSWNTTLQIALDDTYCKLKQAIKPQEFELFSSALLKLGQSDAQSEEELLLYQKERIWQLYNDAAQNEQKQKKLYRALGLSIGVSIGIIMM
ncbi:MAG: stage III sporulation protein AB, partial [Oscillospiraceae bacterium]